MRGLIDVVNSWIFKGLGQLLEGFCSCSFFFGYTIHLVRYEDSRESLSQSQACFIAEVAGVCVRALMGEPVAIHEFHGPTLQK